VAPGVIVDGAVLLFFKSAQTDLADPRSSIIPENCNDSSLPVILVMERIWYGG
jgi:hypothetical protein